MLQNICIDVYSVQNYSNYRALYYITIFSTISLIMPEIIINIKEFNTTQMRAIKKVKKTV